MNICIIYNPTQTKIVCLLKSFPIHLFYKKSYIGKLLADDFTHTLSGYLIFDHRTFLRSPHNCMKESRRLCWEYLSTTCLDPTLGQAVNLTEYSL